MKDSNQLAPKHEPKIWSDLRNGSLEALSYFYQKYYSDLLLYGKRMSPSHELAKDCIQNLFLKIWKKRNTISDVKSCKAYLFISYRRMLLDMLKENDQQGKFSAKDFEVEIMSIEDIIIRDEIDRSSLVQLKKALRSLTKRQQEVIYLRFYRNLSYDEIAETLQVNNQTIRSSVFNSLKLLRKAFLFIGALLVITS